MTIQEALQDGRARLAHAAIEDAAVEAEVLLMHALGRSRAYLYTHPDHPLSADEQDRLGRALDRRLLREPTAYVVGEREFFGHPFLVDRRVLIPRPETEILVETALDLLRSGVGGRGAGGGGQPEREVDRGGADRFVVGACGNRRKDPERPGAGNRALKRQLRTGTAPWFVVGASAPGPRSTRTFRQRSSAAGSRAPGAPGAEAPTTNSRIMVGMQAGPVERPVVADIGTGSGAIAVSLALALPHAVVYAVDISADALAVAAANAARLGVADRVRLLQGDLLAPLPEPADLIVANLPYIPAGDLPALQLEVRAYEPVLALADGPTGLDLIARLLAQAPGHLRPGGALALEVGAGQANGVGTLAAQHLPGAAISTVRDLAGHERVVVVRRCETSCQRILGTD